MELERYARSLWKWKLLIGLAVVVVALSAYWTSNQLPRLYRASTTLAVGQALRNTTPQLSEVEASNQLAPTYVQIVGRTPALQATIDALGLQDTPASLGSRVYANQLRGTQLIQIDVTDTTAQNAKEIADELARQLIVQSAAGLDPEGQAQLDFVQRQLVTLRERIDSADNQVRSLEQALVSQTDPFQVQDTEAQIAGLQQRVASWQGNYAILLNFFKTNRTGFLSVVEPATIPTTPVSPQTLLNVVAAVLAAVALSVGAVLFIEFLDDTIRTPQDVVRVLGVVTLGEIGRIRGIHSPGDQLVAVREPHSSVAEAFRVLRTNVRFSTLAQPGPLVVTSPSRSEGKSTTAANLAIMVAQTGQRVVLVDADLREPSLHRLFDLPNRTGLTQLLVQNIPIDSALAASAVPGLRVLTSGPLPPNPAELLGSSAMLNRIQELEQGGQVVIFDTAPVVGIADSVVLAAAAQATVVMVVCCGQTRSDVGRRAMAMYDQVGIPIIGAILNRQRAEAPGYRSAYAAHAQSQTEVKPSVSRVESEAAKRRHTQPSSSQPAAAGIPEVSADR